MPSSGNFHVATAIRPAADPASEPDADSSSRPPLVVILGPTASGKTGLAIQVAQVLDGEIINADSRQIYRFMDIGTAKPTPEQRAAVPHHLLDIITPDQPYTLAEYQRAAYETINAIHARSRLPLLVGGTGQYITAVIEGWSIPEVPPNPDLRAELEAFASQHGSEALHNRLRDADPDAAARIDHRNVRRVIRALEVYLQTGTPITVLQRKTAPPYRVLQLGLTMARDHLYARIDARVERMLHDGLLTEVRALLEAGYTWDCPAMSGLGYIQWRPYLDGAITLPDVIAAIQHATHAFVRRQYTWFNRHDSGIRWLIMGQTTPDNVIIQIQHWEGD
jgi:tRNA dimethylallyltransferase